MTTLHQITRAGQVVLARLLAPTKAGLTAAKISSDLSKIDPARFSVECVAAALEGLCGQGQVEFVVPPAKPAENPTAKRRASKKPAPRKTPAYRLTNEGRDAALRATNLERLPSKPTWPRLCEHLLRVAVNAKPSTPPLKTKPALAAHMIRHQFDLDVSETAKLATVIAATVCKTLGYPGVSDYKVLEAKVLERIVGTAAGLTPQNATEQFVRSRLGSKQGKIEEFRATALRQWLGAETGSETGAGAMVRRETATDRKAGAHGDTDVSLAHFARRAIDAARRSGTGWFGDNKVFISHAWKSFVAVSDGDVALDLPQFKQQLIRANTAGLLELSRADIVALMDPADVHESEIHYLNTSFHLILVERGRL